MSILEESGDYDPYSDDACDPINRLDNPEWYHSMRILPGKVHNHTQVQTNLPIWYMSGLILLIAQAMMRTSS